MKNFPEYVFTDEELNKLESVIQERWHPDNVQDVYSWRLLGNTLAGAVPYLIDEIRKHRADKNGL